MLTLEVDDVVLPGDAARLRVRPSEGNPRDRRDADAARRRRARATSR